MKQYTKRLAALALALLLLLPSFAALAEKPTPEEIDKLLANKTDKSLIQSPVIDAVNKASQSVVGISIYDMPLPEKEEDIPEPVGTGSGTVVSPWGHVLTNYHVVQGAGALEVVHEGQAYEAFVVGAEPAKDLAVVFAPGLKLPPVIFGDSDALQVGETALAIGSPMGHDLERSALVGIISGLNRESEGLPVEDRYGKAEIQPQTMIQTDAAINPGASGGGLFNILGQLMGVTTLKLSDNTGDMGANPAAEQEPQTPVDNLGMCIPINDALPLIRKVLSEYDGTDNPPTLKTEEEPKVRLGIRLQEMAENASLRQRKLVPRGVVVTEVERGSLAEKVGIQPGDLIVEWNGLLISKTSDMDNAKACLDGKHAGKLVVYRAAGLLEALAGNPDMSLLAGEYKTLTLKLEKK